MPPSFADSFWSGDYAAGLGVLFDKLQQGIVENEQVLTMARLRAEAEEQYGRKLVDIGSATDKLNGGFQRDDGASLKKAYDGVRSEMSQAASSHKKIAANISELVVIPFGRWCAAHENRVLSSQDDLQARIKAYDKQADATGKLRSAYFNKCRQVEDMEEENKLGFQEPEKTESSPQSATAPTASVPEIIETQDESYEIGDEVYDSDGIKKLLLALMGSIRMKETKVAVLGTYTNTSAGSDIVDFVQKSMGVASVGYAEKIGQDLVDNGFLRLIGNVGSTFANSSKMMYQWRPKAFQVSGMPEKKGIDRTLSMASTGSESNNYFGSMNDMLGNVQKWNPLDNPYPNETPFQRLKREARESDEKYKGGVRKLDSLRCNLEEAVIDHLKFMEKCELDRLKAIKSVMLDFSGALSNVIPSIQSTVDNMMLYQESIQPLADLRYIVENYRTGGFVPKVPTYDNYYNKVDDVTFGVDLEARARTDRKRVPIIVTTILTYLDSHYPDLDGDEARRAIWLVDVPLAASHHLRDQINNGKQPQMEILERYEIPIVASVLRLYFLELPDSLVSSQVYEIMKTIYTSPDSSSNAETRISVLQNTLGQLRLANIATLDAITTHFTRLIDLTSADEQYVANLAQSLSPCILRPRTESALTFNDRHAYRLVRDLFDHKEAIFGELKRASSHNMHSGGSATAAAAAAARHRAPSSSDESNRRANMEARNRAIASRSRASSPNPGTFPNGTPTRIPIHRRERSFGAAEGRFPVVGSPTVSAHGTGGGGGEGQHASPGRPNARSRQSLEVPGSRPSSLSQDDGHVNAGGNAAASSDAYDEQERGNGERTSGERGATADTPSATYVPGSDPGFAGFYPEPVTEDSFTNSVDDGNDDVSVVHGNNVADTGRSRAGTATLATQSAAAAGGQQGGVAGGAGEKSEHAGDGANDGGAFGGAGVKKADSLSRSGAVAAAANRLNRKATGGSTGGGAGAVGPVGTGLDRTMARHGSNKRDSAGSLKRESLVRSSSGSMTSPLAQDQGRGVQLVDKPMDD